MKKTKQAPLRNKLTPEYRISFHEKVLNWFSTNARNLPWRHDFQPYHIWLSEIMLQQTQMERGVVFFNRWLERFPTIADIAKASEEEVLHYWEGLGYYSRAWAIIHGPGIFAKPLNTWLVIIMVNCPTPTRIS